MESQTVDTSKKEYTPGNGHISALFNYQTVYMQKRGMNLKSKHKKKAGNPPKQTGAKGIRTVKRTSGYF